MKKIIHSAKGISCEPENLNFRKLVTQTPEHTFLCFLLLCLWSIIYLSGWELWKNLYHYFFWQDNIFVNEIFRWDDVGGHIRKNERTLKHFGMLDIPKRCEKMKRTKIRLKLCASLVLSESCMHNSPNSPTHTHLHPSYENIAKRWRWNSKEICGKE